MKWWERKVIRKSIEIYFKFKKLNFEHVGEKIIMIFIEIL